MLTMVVFTGSQDKERILKRLYQYVCDKATATIKGEKTVSVRALNLSSNLLYRLVRST